MRSVGPRSRVKLQEKIEERDDVLVYTRDLLIKNKKITGPIKVIIYVSSHAIGTELDWKNLVANILDLK